MLLNAEPIPGVPSTGASVCEGKVATLVYVVGTIYYMLYSNKCDTSNTRTEASVISRRTGGDVRAGHLQAK